MWEHALDQQLRRAQVAGEAAGHENRMVFTAPTEADKQRFLEVYNEVAQRNAQLAARYEIDGLRLFRYARGVVANTANGSVECAGEQR